MPADRTVTPAALPSFTATLWMMAEGSIPGIGEAKFTSSTTPSEILCIVLLLLLLRLPVPGRALIAAMNAAIVTGP